METPLVEQKEYKNLGSLKTNEDLQQLNGNCCASKTKKMDDNTMLNDILLQVFEYNDAALTAKGYKVLEEEVETTIQKYNQQCPNRRMGITEKNKNKLFDAVQSMRKPSFNLSESDELHENSIENEDLQQLNGNSCTSKTKTLDELKSMLPEHCFQNFSKPDNTILNEILLEMIQYNDAALIAKKIKDSQEELETIIQKYNEQGVTRRMRYTEKNKKKIFSAIRSLRMRLFKLSESYEFHENSINNSLVEQEPENLSILQTNGKLQPNLDSLINSSPENDSMQMEISAATNEPNVLSDSITHTNIEKNETTSNIVGTPNLISKLNDNSIRQSKRLKRKRKKEKAAIKANEHIKKISSKPALKKPKKSRDSNQINRCRIWESSKELTPSPLIVHEHYEDEHSVMFQAIEFALDNQLIEEASLCSTLNNIDYEILIKLLNGKFKQGKYENIFNTDKTRQHLQNSFKDLQRYRKEKLELGNKLNTLFACSDDDSFVNNEYGHEMENEFVLPCRQPVLNESNVLHEYEMPYVLDQKD